MKFCKQIVRASNVSVQLCEPKSWMDYKKLKKYLKSVDSSLPTVAISNSPAEREFFRLLKRELSKVSATFISLQQHVKQKMRKLHDLNTKNDTKSLSERLKLMTSLHLWLMLLESYAVLNKVGFRKILKKHDKLTGYTTREKYMEKVVAQELFTNHYWIRESLFNIEEQFAAIKREVILRKSQGGSETEKREPRTPEKEPRKRKRVSESYDYTVGKDKYLKEFENHKEQYDQMEDMTKGLLEAKKKPKTSKPPKAPSSQVKKEENTPDTAQQTAIKSEQQQENSGKEEARIALESLALAAEAHQLL